MPKPLDASKRQEILEAIRAGAGWRARNDIAREFGVAASTVGKIAADEGIEEPFDRTNLARASRAKQIDNKAIRTQLASDHLADAVRLRAERLWAPAEVVCPTGKILTLSLPPARDVKDYMASVGAALKISMDVEKHDQGDGGAEEAKSMLLGVAEGLKAMYAASLTDAEPAESDV